MVEIVVVTGLLGLAVGSFLNVCIYRLPREGMSVARGRSRCPRCGHGIAWYDNVPIVSWLALGGRCRQCRGPISPRYLIVEVLTGVVFGLSAYMHLGRGPIHDPLASLAILTVQCAAASAIICCAFMLGRRRAA